MPRLPSPDGDEGQWGTILNEFLRTSHRDDGNLKNTYKVINVLDFGAKGDGIVDDTSSINAAIDQVGNGSTLYFPSGFTFKVTQPLNKIDKNNVKITGGGTIKGENVPGFIFTIGDSGIWGVIMDHLKITMTGATQGGIKWIHTWNFLMDSVVVEDDFTGSAPGSIAIEVSDGAYQGHIKDCYIHGKFTKGIAISSYEKNRGDPHGLRITGCFLSHSGLDLEIPSGGTGISVEDAPAALRTEFNYLNGWIIAIDITTLAGEIYTSIQDHIEGCTTGIKASQSRPHIYSPSISGNEHPNPGSGYTDEDQFPGRFDIGIDCGPGCHDGIIFHPRFSHKPKVKLIRINAGARRVRIEAEEEIIVNHTENNALDTVFYGQATIKLDPTYGTSTIQLGDAKIYRPSSNIIKTDSKFLAAGGLGVGNAETATTRVGALVKKIEVFDAQGNSLGFIPVYGNVT